MKKLIYLTCIVSLFMFYPLNAQNKANSSTNATTITSKYNNSLIEDKLNEISDMKGVSTVYITKSLLSNLGNRYVGGLQLSTLKDKLNSINIIQCENKSSFPQIKEILKSISKYNNMELLTRIVDEDERTEIYLEKYGVSIIRFLMINIDAEEINIIDLTGNFTLDDITTLTKNKPLM